MPMRPSPYYNNPYFEKIGQNLTAAIFGTPELEGMRLQNEARRADLADRETRIADKQKADASRGSFFDALSGIAPVSTPVGSAGAIESPVGGSVPMETQRFNVQQPDMISALLADPNLARQAVEGGVMNFGDISRANETRIARDENLAARKETTSANIASREAMAEDRISNQRFMAEEGARNRSAQIGQQGEMRMDQIRFQALARLDQLSAQHEQERAMFDMKVNDPAAREMHAGRMKLLESQIAATQALVPLRQAQTADETAQAGTRGAGGGARPFQVDPKKREGMAGELGAALQDRELGADARAQQYLLDQMAQQYAQGGNYDLTSLLDGAPTETTPSSFFGLFGGDTNVVAPPVGAPAAAAPAAAPPPAVNPADAISQARAAIARGADKNAVAQRLQSMGIDPRGL